MSRMRFNIGVAVVFLALLCAEAIAQIDYRVPSVNENREGRALDANPQAGAGGLNQNQFSQQNYAFDYGLRSSNIITGNVTGLGRFQGDSPILANNAFRVSIPSAGLAPFRSSTVGLPEITSGRLSYGPGTYYDPQQIISDAGAISRGLNAPGSSQLITPYRPLPLPAQQDLVRALGGQDPLAPGSQQAAPFTPGLRQTEVTSTSGSTGLSPTVSPYSAATASSIFGTPSLDTSLNSNYSFGSPLGLNTSRNNPFAPKPPAPPQGGLSAASSASADLSAGTGSLNERSPSDSPVYYRDPLAEATEAARTGGPADPMTGGGGAGTPRSFGSAAEAARARGGFGGPAVAAEFEPGLKQIPLGDDLFHDLIGALSSAQSAGAPRLGFLGRATQAQEDSKVGAVGSTPGSSGPGDKLAGDRDEKGTIDLSTPPGGVNEVTDKQVKNTVAALRWADTGLDSPIQSFAGKYESQLNSYMTAAEDHLKRGEYYNAAAQYEMAYTIDPANPLPLLGRGHALAAAGDYMSAVSSIERGIARFPQIAAFKIDLLTIAGRVDAFDIRRADLERRLETSEDYRLRFLLGYIELYSGQEERGLRNLETASKAAPADGIIAKFPDLLTGRVELPPIRTGR